MNVLEIFGGFAGGVCTVEAGDDFLCEAHFCVHGMQLTTGDFLFQRCDFLGRAVGHQLVVRPHQFVGNGHYFSEDFAGGLGDADVVAEALGHFAVAVETHENGHRQRHFRGQAVFALDVAVHEQIKFLLSRTDFDIRLENDGVVRRQQWIQEFVDGNGLIAREAGAKIFAFEHAGEAIVAAEADDFVAGEFVEPLAVVADFGFLGIEEFEDLCEVSLGVCVHLFAGERGTGFGLPGGVADHRGEIADQEDGGVAEVLKVLELAEDHGVS